MNDDLDTSAAYDDAKQAANMKAIRARWKREVFASLEDCGGDDSVQVERVAHTGHAQWKATLKTDPNGMSGYASTVSGAISDLHDMLSLWETMLSEKRDAERERYGRGSGE